GAMEAMGSVLMDLRLDRRQFGDLVTPGFGMLAAQRVSTAPAFLRLAVGDRVDALGRHQGPHPTRMSLLPAAAFPRQWAWRLPLDAYRVGRRRLGAVGGVLVEARPYLLDLLLRLGEALLQPGESGPDDRTGLVRETVPYVSRDRRRPVHVALIN